MKLTFKKHECRKKVISKNYTFKKIAFRKHNSKSKTN